MMNEESLKDWEQDHIELLTSREMGEWLHRRDNRRDNRRDMNARPQGEWVRMALDNKTIVYCSECHTHYEYPFNCCPNCGAQMVGGEP